MFFIFEKIKNIFEKIYFFLKNVEKTPKSRVFKNVKKRSKNSFKKFLKKVFFYFFPRVF